MEQDRHQETGKNPLLMLLESSLLTAAAAPFATMPDLPDRIAFAPVAAGDFDELARIRIAAMRESLERLGRFDPERARERLRKSFYPEHTHFILLDAEKIGFYTLRPVSEGLRLEHLYLQPTRQSRGIGSHVLGTLLAGADASGLAIYLGALKESASNRFYRRHGFIPTIEDEWDVYYIRSPRSGKPGDRSLPTDHPT